MKKIIEYSGILALILIIGFIFFDRSEKSIHNQRLDSLISENRELDKKIELTENKIDSLKGEVKSKDTKIGKLKKSDHEKSTHIDSMYSDELYKSFSGIEIKP